MKITTVMVVILIVWCVLTLLQRGGTLPPAPIPRNLTFSDDALGWLKGTVWPTVMAVAIFVGFGHSVLAMSGEESLAQVYREIEQPKVKNLQRAGMVIFAYSLIFTALVSFFAVAIIPDSVRPRFYDNLISGLAMNLVGPLSLRLFFQAFVVVVGFLILAGAANTAIVGSNGVLNRVSEDGVLTDWFRKPHKRFGTTYRLINLIVILQMVTILLSRGDVFVLGEAYAFGVIWSFAFNAISVLILRFKRPDAPRPWRVPFNPRIGGREIPLGLVGIAFVLVACAIVNLFTKEIATIAGIVFTGAFFTMFVVSERIATRRRAAGQSHLDQFQLDTEREIDPEHIGCREGNILVPVRDYNTLSQLDWVLDQPDAASRDVVVLTVRVIGQGHGTPGVSEDQVFSDYEQKLFTRVVAVAERHGRPVTLARHAGHEHLRRAGTIGGQAADRNGRGRRVGDHDARATGASPGRGVGPDAARSPSCRRSCSSSARTGASSGSRSARTCRIYPPKTSTISTGCGLKPSPRWGRASATGTSCGRR